MSIFDLFKKKTYELTEEEQRWNKIWDLWADEKAASPYQELMTYHSEVMNGGHGFYFLNLEPDRLKKELKTLENILPPAHIDNLNRAYKAYLILDQREDESSEITLEECDEFFFNNEQDLNIILAEYASIIEL